MSAIHSNGPTRTEGTNTISKTDTVPSAKVTPQTELPPPPITSDTSSPFQQGKVPLCHAYYTNGCGVAQPSVRTQQPRCSKTQRIGSTTSVCTTNSKKSCKSTASQIQEVAGDELCATLLLACLFCRFSDLLPLLTGPFCCPSCFPLPACNSRLLGLCSDPQGCCCCCCRPDGPGLELCYQTDRCAHCALACLFCEFLSLCSLALECGGCGGCLEACCAGGRGESGCCCGEAADGGHCPCGLGCGMLQDCCDSSDCLEICLECCSICFPA
ncbi:keratin-associated protein 5-1 isoform X1 [Anolis carolinensis]|uniref:keratin-associated protein 5-1 isoform X1 n=1 Tax=Anolis carolinensis TaxID=28377 RepID=UPI002F2B50F9